MALSSKIQTALIGSTLVTTLASTRIYNTRAPQTVIYPYILCTRIGGDRFNGLAGYLNCEHPTIQIDVYSTSYSEARTLAGNIHTVLDQTTTFRAVMQMDIDGFDHEVEKYRVTSDYTCINQE